VKILQVQWRQEDVALPYQAFTQSLKPETSDKDDGGNSPDNNVRYVEPFTQRASMTNLELAEPIEIQATVQSSSLTDSGSQQCSILDEIGKGLEQQSPLKSDYNMSPHIRRESVDLRQEERKEIIKIWKFEPIIVDSSEPKKPREEQSRNHPATLNPLHSFSLRI